MIYSDEKLDSINDIQVGTYNKCICDPRGILLETPYVQNIDNIGSGTVYAKLGANDTYSEKDANVILSIINYGGTCYVAGTPS